MKFKVNRRLILEAAKTVSKIALSNSPIPELNEILVECDKDANEIYLTAANYDVSIQQKVAAAVTQKGSMLINPRLLVGMLEKIDGELVTLSAKKPQLLKVTNGRCVFEIFCLSAENYPKPVFPFPEETFIMTGIVSLANRTAFAVSTDETKPALQCVQIKLKDNAVQATACDGFRLMYVRDAAEPTDEREILLPGQSLKTLASVSRDSDVFEVGDIGDSVVFVRGDMLFTIRKQMTGDYIDTVSLLKAIQPAYSAVVDVAKMREALNLMSINASLGGKKAPVNVILADNEIVFRCKGDNGESSTVIPANVTQGTPADGFYYNVLSLIKLFQVLSGKVKIEIAAIGHMLVKTKNEVCYQSCVSKPRIQSKPIKKGVANDSSQSEQKDEIKKPKRAKGAGDVKEQEEAA